MAKFTIKIDCNTAAFGDPARGERREMAREVRRILNDVGRIADEYGYLDGAVADYNGNVVGSWAFTNLTGKRNR